MHNLPQSLEIIITNGAKKVGIEYKKYKHTFITKDNKQLYYYSD